MTETHALIVVGTAAILMTVLLVLLRAEVAGRHPVLDLTRRWVAMDGPASAMVLAVLLAAAASAFALVPTRPPVATDSEAMGAPPGHAAIALDEDLSALRSYTAALDGEPGPPPGLPGVNDMIETLVTRLAEQPGDVKGWKMLGWSYLNTGRPADAVRAYETALKLVPGDADVAAGLVAAKSALSVPTSTGTLVE
jgi:hypothetical protein